MYVVNIHVGCWCFFSKNPHAITTFFSVVLINALKFYRKKKAKSALNKTHAYLDFVSGCFVIRHTWS